MSAVMDQRMAALERANEVRFAAARWKRETASLPRQAGMLAAAKLLRQAAAEEAPAALLSMRVEDVLLAARGVGRQAVPRLLRQAGTHRTLALVALSAATARELRQVASCVEVEAGRPGRYRSFDERWDERMRLLVAVYRLGGVEVGALEAADEALLPRGGVLQRMQALQRVGYVVGAADGWTLTARGSDAARISLNEPVAA